jgi:hypothetical protein
VFIGLPEQAAPFRSAARAESMSAQGLYDFLATSQPSSCSSITRELHTMLGIAQECSYACLACAQVSWSP